MNILMTFRVALGGPFGGSAESSNSSAGQGRRTGGALLSVRREAKRVFVCADLSPDRVNKLTYSGSCLEGFDLR